MNCQNHSYSDTVSQKVETDSNSSSTKMSRKERIKKKVTIRKTKTPPFVQGVSNINTKLLTKEERAQVQKIKNRESAQRSRDVKKLQMQVMLAENTQLKIDKEQLTRELEELRKVSVCQSCGASIRAPPVEPIQFQNNPQPQMNYFADEDIREIGFSRVIDGDTTKLPMFILVLTIIGMFLMGGMESTKPTAPQLLFEVSTLPQVVREAPSTAVASIQKQKDMCLMEYYRSTQLSIPQQSKQLRQHLRQIPPSYGMQEYKRDIILCSDPQIIRGSNSMNPQNKKPFILSNLFELLLKGSELINLLGQAASKALSPNSMYVVLAEIKQVANYQSPTYCLV